MISIQFSLLIHSLLIILAFWLNTLNRKRMQSLSNIVNEMISEVRHLRRQEFDAIVSSEEAIKTVERVIKNVAEKK